MYVPCILYSLLPRPTNAQRICINNILYIVSTPTCFDALIRLPEDDDDDASKHVGVLTIYKIL